ncbi:hypothetical protein [Flavobacterium aestuarii]|uniref:hypothetical protein n=1 Tax=Flavobacterium aestuarii TaxID=3149227 RepID=UPI0032B57690
MLKQEIFINEFENQEFNFCDIDWWPLIKIQTAYQLHLKRTEVFKLNEGKSYNEIKIKITLKDKLQFYKQIFTSNKYIENIIVTDFTHKHDSDIGIKTGINPYTDPFVYYFENLKITFTLFDFKKEGFLLGYNLKVLKKIFLEEVKQKFSRNSKIQRQLRQFCDFLSLHYGDDFRLYNHLVQNIIINQAEYLMYFYILKKGRIKNILLYCYYNNTMMSIIRAANRLNIETVEYQHSQVTSNHFAYSSWGSNTKNSKDFFPSKIWVWRESDAEYLTDQFKDIKKIEYVVGGNLSLISSKIVKVLKTDSNIRVLVTLQGIGLPDYIIDCLNKNSNLILYLRLHPRYPQDREMCEILKLKYKEQVEIDIANSLTLHELLAFSDYHLTNYSGSAIEADYFDVTNIIYGDKGYVTYQNEIESQKYLFINSQDDLVNILEKRLKYKLNSKGSKPDISKLIKENFN